MKRSTFASLGLAVAVYLGLAAAPAFALNSPPPAPIASDNCHEIEPVPVGPVVWPSGPHSYYCGSAQPADGTKMINVLKALYARTKTEMIGLAGTTTRGNFYLFGSTAEFNLSSLAAYGVAGNEAPASTVDDASGNLPPIFTAVWLKNGNNKVNGFPENAVAHELGHWFDALNGAAVSATEQITLNLPNGVTMVPAGHQIFLTIANGNLPNGAISVSAIAGGGETLTSMATKLKAAITTVNNPLLTATSTGPNLKVNYLGLGSGPTYSYAVTGAGTLEQVWLDTGPKVSDQAFFKHLLHGPSPETATIGGTFAAGSKFTFNFREAPPSIVEHSVSYTVVAGNTASDVATAITGLINANSGGQVIAASAGAVITMTSASGNTDYSATVVANASETVTLLGDVPRFNQDPNCNAQGTGLFTAQRDHNTDYICSTSIQGSVGGGPAHAGTITLTVTDDTVPANKKVVSVGVALNESSSDIAAALALKITTQLSTYGIKASAPLNSNTLTIVSSTGDATTYVFAPGTTTVALQLQVPAFGNGSTLFTKPYTAANVGYSNWTKLTVTAWPDFYVPDKEMVAEYYAVLANYTDRFFPGNIANDQSLDRYLTFNPGFTCINNLLLGIGNTRLRPTNVPAGCPAN